MPPWLQITLPIALSALTAWLVSFSKWDFEKRKLRYDERKIFLKEVRDTITRPEFYLTNFIDTVLYSRLRDSLSKKIRDELELHSVDSKSRLLQPGDNLREDPINQLLDDLTRIEKKWGLL